MDAKTMLSTPCSNPPIPSIRSSKKPCFPTLPIPSSPCSFVQSNKLKPCRLCPSISPRVSFRKRIECRISEVEAVGFAIEQNIRTGIRRKKLAVFVSGGGSNFRSIREACLQGSVQGEVVVLVTNKRGCGGAEFAREKDIPVILFQAKDEPNGLSPTDLVAVLRRFEVDFILLAGYLRIIPVELIQAYPKSIVNIHPSLLPAFGGKGYYGMKVHKAVVASGARFSGPTIHFVDEHYDTGPIVAQSFVPVLADDSAEELAARVLLEEHRLYVDVVSALCEDRIVWKQDGVPLIRSKENPNEYFSLPFYVSRGIESSNG
ncbi:hypothetical protein UlMin_022410 [Ulmus minor]